MSHRPSARRRRSAIPGIWRRPNCSSWPNAAPAVVRRQGSFLLRPARRRLLPIGQRVPGIVGAAPTRARGGERRLFIAVEEIEAAAVLAWSWLGGAAGPD